MQYYNYYPFPQHHIKHECGLVLVSCSNGCGEKLARKDVSYYMQVTAFSKISKIMSQYMYTYTITIVLHIYPSRWQSTFEQLVHTS